MANRISLGEAGRASGPNRLFNRLVRGLQANTRTRARRNIGFHYDLGNDFYAAWLDETLTYSSAIFAEPTADGEPLESAPQRKVRLLLDRLNLKPGATPPEHGSGWGYLRDDTTRENRAKAA